MVRQKRVAAIHDISCFGKCSLTVALPVLAAAGLDVPVIPTALLSAHGGFNGGTYRDLTDDILPIVRHWQSLKLDFDAIYTGFLGSSAQIDLVLEAIARLRGADALVVVDPVMADGGQLYSMFKPDFPAHMRRLCARADVITPNLTEAALLLGMPCGESLQTREETDALLRALSALGPEKVVVTGVSYAPGELGAASYDRRAGRFDYACAPRVESAYHGAGAVFASVLVAALLAGKALFEAARIAVRYTADSVARTRAAGADERLGVRFEEGLADLRRMLAEG
jgi:pyridoxine kinase